MSLLAQRLRLQPGADTPVAGVREPLAERLLRARPAALAPAMLGSLYALCGHAHRSCAEMALQALQAPDTPVQPDAKQRQALWSETLREHVRRLFLDWPRLLGSHEGDGRALAASPALASTVEPGSPALVDWLERQVLGLPMAVWSRACQESPASWLLQWTHEIRNPLTLALRQAQPLACTWTLPLQDLRPDAEGAVLTALAAQLREDADFSRLPHVQGQWRETGCWSRAADAELPIPDVWTRLAARVHDLAQLGQPGGAQRLCSGARALGGGEALAWCEMARGLLVHWLRVDVQGRVERYGILAPTEWNFHPRGAVAQVLRQLPNQVSPQQMSGAVGLLVAAFDPCVEYDLDTASTAREVVRA